MKLGAVCAVVKTKNAVTGGSTFNFTAQGEKLIKFSKSLDDFIKALHANATKVNDATKTSTGGVEKDVADESKKVKTTQQRNLFLPSCLKIFRAF